MPGPLMIQLVLRKKPSNRYRVAKFKKFPLDTLADFLIRDGSCKHDFNDLSFRNDPYITWLKNSDPENDWIGGNTMELVKRDGKIYVGSQFREDRDDYSQGFSTTPGMMVQIMYQWYDILAMDPRPDEVIIAQEGDRIEIYPKLACSEITLQPA